MTKIQIKNTVIIDGVKLAAGEVYNAIIGTDSATVLVHIQDGTTLAYDIFESDYKVIDIAVRYAYSRDNGYKTPWPWIYFHGEIENTVSQYCATGVLDLVAGDGDVPDCGVHPVIVYGVPALAFVWNDGNTDTGLIVDPKDEPSFFDAIEQYQRGQRVG